jgi:AcrR family transcriptional regulator
MLTHTSRQPRFRDKTDIFIKVYERWQHEEASMLQRPLAKDASDARLVQAVVTHHRRFRIFRRSLRQLSIERNLLCCSTGFGRRGEPLKRRTAAPSSTQTAS